MSHIPLKRGLAMRTLTIKLTGLFQSYGKSAVFYRRTSYQYPTKSTVIGMIGAALGYRRDDPRIKELNHLQFAVRIDQPGRPITDFQNIEYDKKHERRSLSYRDYLQDAVFVAAIGGDDQQIDQIDFALHHPKFQLSLGRRANVPSGPLVTNIFDDQQPYQVLESFKWQAASWYKQKCNDPEFSTEIIADSNLIPDTKPSGYVKDNVGSFNPDHRWYFSRAITKVRVALQNDSYQGQNTDHDIMATLSNLGK